MSLKEFDAGSGVSADAFPERIHVDQVSLYTDPAQNVVQRIALQQLIESPTNPRTTFNQQALQKMAETIRGSGVLQAILVRPVSYANIVREGEPVQAYEIVFGHRRYRASQLAEVPDIPAIVRELTDAQTAQLQSIENVQREDLNPMEAARSYQQYLQAHGVTKDQLAEEIGLSRSHVYSYLALLKVVPVIQEALRAGEIGPDVGIRIARLHTPKLQERALAAIKGKYYDLEDGGKKSVRQITEFLAEKFTLKLSEAIFDTKDAQLLEGADACTTCPKRTGNAPEYEDLAQSRESDWRGTIKGNANLCTDPDCFDAKKKAALRNKAEALEAKGKTVIAGNKARAIVSATGEIKAGYISLKDVKAALAKGKSKKADAPPVATVLIQNPRDGKTVEVVKAEDLKAAGVNVKAPKASGQHGNYQEELRQREEERQKRGEKALQETRVNCSVLAAVRKAAAAAPRSAFDLQMVAMAAVAGVGYQSRGVLEILHGFSNMEQLRKAIGQMGVEQLTTLMLDCALVDGVTGDQYTPPKADTLMRAAKHYGVDVAAIRKEVQDLPVDVKTQDLLLPTAQGTETPDPAGAALAASPQEPKKARKASKQKGGAPASTQEVIPGVADATQHEEASAASTALASGAREDAGEAAAA